jgi:glutathione S-transferase
MISLATFGPAFGLPDPSPFCLKAMVLLKMSGLPHSVVSADVRKAPKGKLPYLDDAGTRVPDTTFMRWHLESRHGIDFDKGLSAAERATGWALEKLCEDNLYWVIVYERWMVDENFDKGPRKFFDAVPALLRPVIVSAIRKSVRRNLYGQGMGRHTRSEILQIGTKTIDSIAAVLDTKPWLMGAQPTGSDAAVWGAVAAAMVPMFDSALVPAATRHKNLVAYRDRGLKTWFPEFTATG